LTGARLLLCRPRGGLNDMLCQIEKCCLYAERFGRTVVVDTRYQSFFSFRDSFSNYFVSRRDDLVLDADAVLDRLDRLDVVPACLAGRVTTCRSRFDYDIWKMVDEETGTLLSFDFERDYDASLLVHEAVGGGEISLGALARLRLADGLVEILLERLARIATPYCGVHVRDTDYRAKYERGLAAGKLDTKLPIFLATDNRDVVTRFVAVLGRERVHSFAELPAVAGTPAHNLNDPSLAYPRNRDSILDLVMLALSSHLYLFELEPNTWGVPVSGFSVLAANLHNARPVLKSLISDDPAVLEAIGLGGA